MFSPLIDVRAAAIEKEKGDLQAKLVSCRVTEQKANTIVDANTKRAQDLARDLEAEKKRRTDERHRIDQGAGKYEQYL